MSGARTAPEGGKKGGNNGNHEMRYEGRDGHDCSAFLAVLQASLHVPHCPGVGGIFFPLYYLLEYKNHSFSTVDSLLLFATRVYVLFESEGATAESTKEERLCLARCLVDG